MTDDVPTPALPWLLGVARNVLRDNFRAQARHQSFTAELRAWTEPAEGDIAEHVAERLSVLRALAGLGEDDREVLMLVAWQGLTPRDAARVVGCSAAALRVRLHRARKRLAQAVDEGPSARRTGTGQQAAQVRDEGPAARRTGTGGPAAAPRRRRTAEPGERMSTTARPVRTGVPIAREELS